MTDRYFEPLGTHLDRPRLTITRHHTHSQLLCEPPFVLLLRDPLTAIMPSSRRLLLALALLLVAGVAGVAEARPFNTGSDCTDVPTPLWTCAQQLAWGKCGQAFMAFGDFCAATCGRCSAAAGPSAAPAPAAQPTASGLATAIAAASVNASASQSAPAGALSGKKAEYGKVGGRGAHCTARLLPPRCGPTESFPRCRPTAGPPPRSNLQALGLSWLYYYAQRSGKLSSGQNPIPWRSDSHLYDAVVGAPHAEDSPPPCCH